MPTQDFIYPRNVDKPRHEQNMPENIDRPPSKRWQAKRVGDTIVEKSEDDSLLGNPGPDGGYARKLFTHIQEDIYLVEHENIHDVEAIVSEIAMRRASTFSRGPIMSDVKFACHILSYDEEPTKGQEKWRPILVNDTAHDEHKRRRIVNSIPKEIIVSTESDMSTVIHGWWEKLKDFF